MTPLISASVYPSFVRPWFVDTITVRRRIYSSDDGGSIMLEMWMMLIRAQVNTSWPLSSNKSLYIVSGFASISHVEVVHYRRDLATMGGGTLFIIHSVM